tara:strand:+ start:237 stop:623 length:387 start_codon:yes stop_codon:yes gene_type:complete
MNKYILLYFILIFTNGFINSNIVTKNKNNKNNKKNIKIYYKNDEFENINDEFKNMNEEKININQIKKAAVASGYIKYIKEIIQETFIPPKDCFFLIKILYAMYPRKQKKCMLCNERPNNGTYCDECKL